MAPTKRKAASAGATLANGYRREHRARGDGVSALTDGTGFPADDDRESGAMLFESIIGSRRNDFTERSWWMVDVDADGEGSSAQGATTLVKRCRRVYDWDLPKTRKVLSAYKQFLGLKKELADWDATSLSPCHLVDQMWHQHILDVFHYNHDMLLLCGHLVGHNPDGALDFAAKAQRDQFTRESLRQKYGSYDAAIWDNVQGGNGNRTNNIGSRVIHERAPAYLGVDSIIDDQPITVGIKDQNGEETIVKIKMTTHMSKVFNFYAKRKGVEVEALRFLLDGGTIDGQETPRMLALADEDQIDVILVQGGC